MNAASDTAKYQGVIFDMDGTIVEPLLDFHAIRRRLGIAADEGIIEAIAAMAEPQRRLAAQWLEEQELAAACKTRLMSGAAAALAAVRAAGLKTALLTRNTAAAMRTVLGRFRELAFDLTMSREDGKIKPEPDGILHACRAMGISATYTICVGDFLYDLIAAKAAGAVAVLLAPGPRPDFAHQADHVIAGLDELPALLGLASPSVGRT
ncbi:MAG: HAD-IA family hydrolase [Planctomycetaceae bacterium]|nr:HAD-IA family hydrolase [Planctomycetaceae bacterium]